MLFSLTFGKPPHFTFSSASFSAIGRHTHSLGQLISANVRSLQQQQNNRNVNKVVGKLVIVPLSLRSLKRMNDATLYEPTLCRRSHIWKQINTRTTAINRNFRIQFFVCVRNLERFFSFAKIQRSHTLHSNSHFTFQNLVLCIATSHPTIVLFDWQSIRFDFRSFRSKIGKHFSRGFGAHCR